MTKSYTQKCGTYLLIPELVSAWLEWGEQLADERSRIIVGHGCGVVLDGTERDLQPTTVP